MVAFDVGYKSYEAFDPYTNDYIRPVNQQLRAQDVIKDVVTKMPKYENQVMDILTTIENFGGVFTVAEQRQCMEEATTRLKDFEDRTYKIAYDYLREKLENYNGNMDAANCKKAFDEMVAFSREKAEACKEYFYEALDKRDYYYDLAYESTHVDHHYLNLAHKEETKMDASNDVINQMNANLIQYTQSMEQFCHENQGFFGISGSSRGYKVVDWGNVRQKAAEIANYIRPGDTYPC